MNKKVKLILVIVVGLILCYIVIDVVKSRSKSPIPQTAWTPAYNGFIYNMLLKEHQDVYIDSDNRKLTDCAFGKIKLYYPNGIGSISSDSFKVQFERFKGTCSASMVLHLIWSDSLIVKIRDNIRKESWFKNIRTKSQDKFCDCYVNRLKEIYKNGYNIPIHQSKVDSVYNYCSMGLKK